MSHARYRLTARTINSASTPGLLHDGGGLYLQVSGGGARSWLFRYMLNGIRRDMGLGPAADVTLADARRLADEYRIMVKRDRLDPIEERKRKRLELRAATISRMTFEECATSYIAAQEASWSNPKHRQQWANTLATYAYPVIGEVAVADIDTSMILKVLEPIWKEKTETATRVRGRIEKVLGWAATRELRSGENPARWKDHLKNLLPEPGKIAPVKHMKALPYEELPSFMEDLMKRDGAAARALELQILTAARPGEVVGMTWGELDLDAGTWIVPAARMKMRKEHRVPLSTQALTLMKRLRANAHTECDGASLDLPRYVFLGGRGNGPLSNNAVGALLKRMKVDVTAHGFRSTFSDWCAECTNHPAELREMALAHAVGDKVEAAYRRGDMFEKRRALMQDWADYANRHEG